MNRIFILFVSLFFCVLISVKSNGQNFPVTYTFANVTSTSGLTDPTPVPTINGAVLSSFTAVGQTTSNPNATGRFSFTGWPTGATNASNLFTGSMSTSQYYEVTVTPATGYTLDLNSITFTLQRSSTGIRQYAVRSSLDFSNNLPASISPSTPNLSVVSSNVFQVSDATSSAENGSTITLGSAYDALSSPVTFRFYGWNAEASGGTFSIDNVVFSGTANTTTPTSIISLSTSGTPGEPASPGSFIINFNPATTSITEVDFAFAGTSSYGTDYTVAFLTGTTTGTNIGKLTVGPGTSSVTINIQPVNDNEYEGSETIILTLTNPTQSYTPLSLNATHNLSSEDIGFLPLANGNVIFQNFNSLSNSGTNPLTIEGWGLSESGTSANVNQQYGANDGSSNSADVYSYGSSASDRALGGLRSGSLVPLFGSAYINLTGTTITRLKISYTGEQWRLGSTGRNDRLDFQYSLDATGLSTGSWIDVNELDFIAPISTLLSGSSSQLDGNNPANRSLISFEVSGLSIPAGANFYIRWIDADASGADDGLAIDDFNIEANPLDLTPPAISSLTPGDNTVDVTLNGQAKVLFNETVQKGTGNIYVKRQSDDAVVFTFNVNSPSVVVSGTNATFPLNNLIPNTGYYIQIENGTIEDISGNDFAGITNNTDWTFTTGTTLYAANFQNCSTGLPDGFTQYSKVGAQVWGCTTFGIDANHSPTGSAAYGVQINGFSGVNIQNEDWLISPSLNLVNTSFPLLSFWSRTAFTGASLQLKVSTNYSGTGDPSLATWTDLNGKFPGQTSDIWKLSDNINLSDYKSPNTYFAFVYYSTSADGARWTLDDITFTDSQTPPPPSLTVNPTDIQFNFIPYGSFGDRTFTVIGNDLVDDLTISSTGEFLVSKDGTNFSSSITYLESEANNVTLTVFARFLPNQVNMNFTGNIQISSEGASNSISLKGTSIDPATTLEVVNWNLEWFGSPDLGPTNDDQQQQNVQTILNNISADLFGVVEIIDEARLASVVSNMPGYAYTVGQFGSHVSSGISPLNEAQKLGFIYKTSVFSNVVATKLIDAPVNSTSYYNWSSGRFPYMLSADVTLNCVTKRMHFILIHAKANTAPTTEAYNRRKAAADELHAFIESNYPNDNVIILGDFNDDLDNSITAGFTTSSYNIFTSDPANYFSPTLSLSLAGKKSTVSYNDMIDHVMVSNEVQPYYMPGTANVLTDVTGLVARYGSTTTDHYPIFTRYKFEDPALPTITCPSDQTITSTVCGAVVNYTVPYTGCFASIQQVAGLTSGSTFPVGTTVNTFTVTDILGRNVSCSFNITVTGQTSSCSITAIPSNNIYTGGIPTNLYLGYGPQSLTLNAIPVGGNSFTYSWTGSNLSNTSAASTIFTPTAQGIYTFTVVVTNEFGCSSICSITVNVYDIRVPHNNPNKVYICHNGNTIAVNNNAAAAHLNHGDVLGKCGQQLQNVITRMEIGENVSTTFTVTASPNPAIDEFRISINSSNDEPVIIRIFDISGRTVKTMNTIANTMIKTGAEWQPGLYFAEIRQGLNKQTIKLLKVK